MVSKLQNCELKQEPCTPSTELQQTHEFHGHGKTRTLHTVNRDATNSRITRSGKNIYTATSEMWGRNCSEFVASGGAFVLTLNRASALKVEGNE